MLRLWQIPAKPARGIWARILELDIGTINNGFRAYDLTPGGSKKRSYRFLMHWMCMAWKRIRGLGGDQRRPPVRPHYGDSVRTSLKNVQNFAETSKLRQNSVKVTFDTREVRPQYGDSVRTSLKNDPNLSKSPKLRQNSDIAKFDRFSIDFQGLGVTRGGPGAPPVWGFSADLLKKRPKFCKRRNCIKRT